MREQLIWLGLSAVLGAVVSHLATVIPDQNSTINIYLLSLLALIFIALLSRLGPLPLMLSGSKNIDLSGRWESGWTYKKDQNVVKVSEQLLIKQYGRYIIGQATSTKIEGPHPFQITNYKFWAKIDKDMVLEGNWRNIEKGKSYRGYLMGFIAQGSHRIDAKWVGTETGGVRYGDLVMIKR